MTPDRHARLSSLFLQARRLPRRERATFLADAIPDDGELRDRLTAMLREDDSSLVVLDEPPIRLSLDYAERATIDGLAQPKGAEIPKCIGPYPIRGLLGVGGTSIVYRGWQADPGREVAIKVLRPSMTTGETLRRFRFEAQTQARLNHPGIVPVYDADVSNSREGQTPFIVMELVDGAPITAHVGAQQPALAARVALLLSVCEAVQYAHQRGVLHRDLKPSNILVDRTGRARVVDFGIARVFGDARARETRVTQAGQLLGTLAYMSPEQMCNDAADAVDTRSDLYSLGVIVYEVLSGRRPYELAGKNLSQTIEAITRGAPLAIDSVHSFLSSDFAVVVGKALEKDPLRRYATVSEFADDLRRAQNCEPIRARKPTVGYYARRFVQRNRALSAAVAVAAIAGLVAAIGVTWGFVQVSAQQRRTVAALTRAMAAEQVAEQQLGELAIARDRAEYAAGIGNAVSKFLMSILAHANPEDDPQRAYALRGILGDAETMVRDGRFDDAPLVMASLLRTIGRAYTNLEQLDDAERNLRDASALYQRVEAEQTGRLLSTNGELSRVLRQQGRFEAAAIVAAESLALQREALGPAHEKTLRLANRLAIYQTDLGHYGAAEATLRDAIESSAESIGAQHKLTGVMHANLARVFNLTGRFDEAASELDQAIAIAGAHGSLTHPRNASLHQMSGTRYLRNGEFDKALAAYVLAATISQEALGPVHSSTLLARANQATTLIYLARNEEASALLHEIYDARVAALGVDHPDVIHTMSLLGSSYREAGDLDQSLHWATQAYESANATFGEDHPKTLTYATYLSRTFVARDEVADAFAVLDRVNAIAGDSARDDELLKLKILEAFAFAYMADANYRAAEGAAREALSLLQDSYGAASWEFASAQVVLAKALIGQQRTAEARELLTPACAQLAKILGENHPYTLECRQLLE